MLFRQYAEYKKTVFSLCSNKVENRYKKQLQGNYFTEIMSVAVNIRPCISLALTS